MPDEEKQEFAPGLPDPARFGSSANLKLNEIVPFYIQLHKARRAGTHKDIRVHGMPGDKTLSFATKKEIPKPGERPISLFQQPLHTARYSDFQGELKSGYGAGTVSTERKGSVQVLEATPQKIKLVTGDQRFPEYFTLVRMSGSPKEGTDRTRRTQGGSWLMLNTTPTEPVKHKKVHYKILPPEQIDKLFKPEHTMSEKIDGAASFLRLLKNNVEVLSYRPQKGTGHPIVHTARIPGLAGKKIDIPKEYQNSVLRGELWGEQGGKAIPPQELGGILNSTLANSLKQQKERDIHLRMALFGIKEMGGVSRERDPIHDVRRDLKNILVNLPSEVFHEPAYAETEDEKRKMWSDIVSGKNPRTHEGVVGFPNEGGVPYKVKLRPEYKVLVHDIFPGEGKYQGKGAGGFEYKTDKGTARVGTGFSDEERKRMHETPEEYIGRMARITAQEQFPGGAYRAPSYIALHEDIPQVKASKLVNSKKTDIIDSMTATTKQSSFYWLGKQAAGSLSAPVITPKNIAKELINVQPEDASNEIRKKRHKRLLLYPGAALAGVGTGALVAGHKMLSNEGTAGVDRFLQLPENWASSNTPAYDSSRFIDYVQQGHRAAKAKIFGMPATNYVKLIRDNPIMNWLDTKYFGGRFGWKPDSAQHYNNFAKSEEDALTQLYNEGISNKDNPAPVKLGLQPDALKNLTDELAKRRSEFDQYASGEPVVIKTPGYEQKLRSGQLGTEPAAFDFIPEKDTGSAYWNLQYDPTKMKYMVPPSPSLPIRVSATDKVKGLSDPTVKTQPSAAEFRDYLRSTGSPELIRAMDAVERHTGSGMHEALQGYKYALGPGTAIRNALITTGLIATPIGAYLLYKYFHKPKKQNTEIVEQPIKSGSVKTADNRYTNYNTIAKYIAGHEGTKPIAYDDGKGNITVGRGFNMGSPGASNIMARVTPGVDFNKVKNKQVALTPPQISNLFGYSTSNAINRASHALKGWNQYPPDVQSSIADNFYRSGKPQAGMPNTWNYFNQGLTNPNALTNVVPEYLRNNEYMDSKTNVNSTVPGVATRMDANAATFEKFKNDRLLNAGLLNKQKLVGPGEIK